MHAALQHGKVFSKDPAQTPIADVSASIIENGRYWHGTFTVSSEELLRFGLDARETHPEYMLHLADGRRAPFVESRREVRFGEHGVRLHIMGTKALQ